MTSVLRRSAVGITASATLTFAVLAAIATDAGHGGPGRGTGTDRPVADIRSNAAVTIVLDNGTRVLTPIDAPQLGRGAYQAVASWGQTAYFDLTVEMLKQMAASQKLELNVRAADDSVVNFVASSDTRRTLTEYLHARGITGD